MLGKVGRSRTKFIVFGSVELREYHWDGGRLLAEDIYEGDLVIERAYDAEGYLGSDTATGLQFRPGRVSSSDQPSGR